MTPQIGKLILFVGAMLVAGILVMTRKAWMGALAHGWPSVWRIAKMTVAEARRKRVLQAVVVLVVLIIASLNIVSYLSPVEQARMVKDSGLMSITLFGMLLSIFVGAFMIPHEIESRTIYPILAKPVRRYEFLLGKYLGALIILGVIVAILTVVLVGVLLLQAHVIGVPQAGQPDSKFDAAIPAVIFAAVMSYCALAVLTALIMLISAVSSTTMTVIGAILLWGVGSMQSMLYDLSTKMVGASRFVLWLFYHAVPPLQDFDFRTNVANGIPIDAGAAVQALGAGLLYIIVALLFASLFFENRQV